MSAEFKARIAKEALNGEKTIAEIASSNDISPAQVGQWKQEAETRMQELFVKTDKKAADKKKGGKTDVAKKSVYVKTLNAGGKTGRKNFGSGR